MTRMKKSYLSMAMAAALTGAVVAPASAVTLSVNNLGDAAVIPYYTVRDGWMTDFYIINDSAKTVAAKIRFHESRNSREVLDFIVVLSPYDMISAYVTDSADGPILRFPQNSESSCVVPIPNGRDATTGYGGTLPFSALRYTGNYDDTGDVKADPYDIDRAREGYFTVVEMGTSIDFLDDTTGDGDPISVAYNSMHDKKTGKPRDCLAVQEAFRVENILPTYEEFDRSENNLKVGWSLTNVNRGTQGSDTATMFANFGTEESVLRETLVSRLYENRSSDAVAAARAAYSSAINATANYRLLILAATDNQCDLAVPPPAAPATDPCPKNNRATYSALVAAQDNAYAALNDAIAANAIAKVERVRNLISAQDPVFEEQPDLNSGDLQAYWIDEDENDPRAITAPYWYGHDAITALLMHSAVLNEWATNPTTGAASDFVLTSPTKHFYVDRLFTGSTDRSFQPFLGGEFKDEGGQSCDTVLVDYWNNDEVGTLDPVLPSPSPEYNLCWEVNVLHANSNESVLGAVDSIPVTFPKLAGSPDWNGWMRVNLADDGNAEELARWHSSMGVDWFGPSFNAMMPKEKSKAYSFSMLQRAFTKGGTLLDMINMKTAPKIVPILTGAAIQYGMPYIGFNMKERDMGIAANAYSGIIPHSYEQYMELGWTAEVP